jgi:hypothetical protein
MNEKLIYGNDLEYIDEMMMGLLDILIEEASDNFWKILKYGAVDSTTNPLYTISDVDKLNMIKQNDSTTRILLRKYNNDITSDAHTEIRLFNAMWNYGEVGNADIYIGWEIISENKIINLIDGKTTLNYIRHELYRIFNNRSIFKGIGRISTVGSRGMIATFNDAYQGYAFDMRVAST